MHKPDAIQKDRVLKPGREKIRSSENGEKKMSNELLAAVHGSVNAFSCVMPFLDPLIRCNDVTCSRFALEYRC